MELTEVSAIEFPQDLLTLSLCDNKIEDPSGLIAKIQYLNLRVLWLNGNPVADDPKMQ